MHDLLSYLPLNNLDPVRCSTSPKISIKPTRIEALDTLCRIRRRSPTTSWRGRARVLDDGDFLQVSDLYAPNIVTGFGRVEGRSVGVIANQPIQLAGTLDIDAVEKAARFVRFCDAFNIPILTLVDVPGFLPGTDQEYGGIIRRGAKLIYAYAEATVPKITLITRKAYGGAYIVMGSKKLGADINLAWPTRADRRDGRPGCGEHRLSTQSGGRRRGRRGRRSCRAELIQDYEDALLNPYLAAEEGYIDAVIKPSETRNRIVRSLRALKNKHVDAPARKHGNIPL